MRLTGMICLWAGNLTTNFEKMSNPHTMPCFPPTPPPPHPNQHWFTLIGDVVPFQLTRGRDIWPLMVHFCLRLTVICILINFDLRNIRSNKSIFRYSIKIDNNQSKSITIYRLIPEIDGSRVFVIIDLYGTTGYCGVLHVLISIGNKIIRAIM